MRYARLMTLVASRELRNRTRAVLDQVTAGHIVTVTVSGRPVADIRPHEPAATDPAGVTGAELLELQRRRRPSRTRPLSTENDYEWIRAGDTDDLGAPA